MQSSPQNSDEAMEAKQLSYLQTARIHITITTLLLVNVLESSINSKHLQATCLDDATCCHFLVRHWTRNVHAKIKLWFTIGGGEILKL